MALRGLFIINPEQNIEQITMNNMGIGRNVDEAKRLLQACQFVAEHGEVILPLYSLLPHEWGIFFPCMHMPCANSWQGAQHALLCTLHHSCMHRESVAPSLLFVSSGCCFQITMKLCCVLVAGHARCPQSDLMQVCPADWQPGGKSIKPSAEGSIDYFQEAGKDTSHEEDFGSALKPIKSRQEFEQLIQGDKPVVLDFYAPWCAYYHACFRVPVLSIFACICEVLGKGRPGSMRSKS